MPVRLSRLIYLISEEEWRAILLTRDDKEWLCLVKEGICVKIAIVDSKATVSTGFLQHISFLVTHKKLIDTVTRFAFSGRNIQHTGFEC